MRKISTRIILLVLICSIGISVLVGATAMIGSKAAIEKEANQSLLAIGQVYTGKFNEDLLYYETIISDMYQIVDGTIDTTRLYEDGYFETYGSTILNPIIQRITKETRKCAGFYIVFDSKYTGKTEGIWAAVDDKGNLMHATPTNIAGKSEDDLSAAFYYDAIKAGKGNWSNPYINDVDLNVMSYSIPIIINNVSIGIIGGDMSVEELKKEVEDVKLYNTGYAFLLNKDYDYLVHPSLDQNNNLNTMDGGKYSYIVDEMKNKDFGVIDTNFDGDKNLMAFSKLYDDKIIVIAVPKAEILSDMYKTFYIILGVIIVSAMLATIIALYLGKKISDPIVFVTEILETTSKLDLTDIEETEEILNLLDRKDEVGSIFRATGVLREEIRKMIRAIEDTTMSIVVNTNSLTSATNETTQAINDMAKTVEELAQASMGQAEDAETGSEKLNKLANEIKVAVENGEIVVESSMKAQRINEEGSRAMDDMVEKFNMTNDSTNIVAKNVNSLLEKSQSIGSILNTIINISEQTNLLALNAAIEAARAGEAGRGFAVVAEEIRKLSEQTGHATNSIEDILNAIQLEVETTKESMDGSEIALNDANNTLDQAKKSFEEIYSAIVMSIEAIRQLEKKLEVVDSDKEEVIIAIQSISSVTEETAASTEELSASMEEQAATMETISNNTERLSKTIETLNEMISRFKI